MFLPVSVGQQCGHCHAGAPAQGRTRLRSGSAGAGSPPGGRSPPCLRSQLSAAPPPSGHRLRAARSSAAREAAAPRAGLHAGQSPAAPGTLGSDSPSPRPYHRSCPHSRRGDRARPSAPTAASRGHLQVRAPHRQRRPLPPLRAKHLEDDQEVTHVDITHSGPATGNYPNRTGESSNIL